MREARFHHHLRARSSGWAFPAGIAQARPPSAVHKAIILTLNGRGFTLFGKDHLKGSDALHDDLAAVHVECTKAVRYPPISLDHFSSIVLTI